ncbi:uncharacterized protein zgc:172121 isoform X2 [Oncorhynchus nerka]|uniref:uncharacterized protein zgc:172121 isoform X2 n=1 Tax=Oncorhynchus nerka TaxID=8023 RepID=UPI0031B849FD
MDKTDILTTLMDVGRGPLIVDGGLATELESTGCKLQGDPLWSARLLHTNPQAIKDAHYRFLCAGADVITTATYQASVEGFIRHLDVTPEQANRLIMSGVTLAREAVKHFMADQLPSDRSVPLVAGSVGPYGAFMHNGSEYTGAYAAEMSVERIQQYIQPASQLQTTCNHGSPGPPQPGYSPMGSSETSTSRRDHLRPPHPDGIIEDLHIQTGSSETSTSRRDHLRPPHPDGIIEDLHIQTGSSETSTSRRDHLRPPHPDGIIEDLHIQTGSSETSTTGFFTYEDLHIQTGSSRTSTSRTSTSRRDH